MAKNTYRIIKGYWSDKCPDMCKLHKIETVEQIDEDKLPDYIESWKRILKDIVNAIYCSNNLTEDLIKLLGISREEAESFGISWIPNNTPNNDPERIKIQQIIEEKYGYGIHKSIEKQEINWTKVFEFNANN